MRKCLNFSEGFLKGFLGHPICQRSTMGRAVGILNPHASLHSPLHVHIFKLGL